MFRRLLASNDGPAAIRVTFAASPDGINPDANLNEPVDCPAGMAVCAYADGLHPFWRISAVSTTNVNGDPTANVRWGVQCERFPATFAIPTP